MPICHFSDKSSTTRQSEAKNLECINYLPSREGNKKTPCNSVYSVVKKNYHSPYSSQKSKSSGFTHTCSGSIGFVRANDRLPGKANSHPSRIASTSTSL